MKNYLKPYAQTARVLLIGVGAFLVAFGFLTTASVQLVIGAALSFGVAFWKLYDIATGKVDGGEPYTDIIKIMLAAVSTILLAFGYVDGQTLATMSGAAISLAVTLWTVFTDLKNKTK